MFTFKGLNVFNVVQACPSDAVIDSIAEKLNKRHAQYAEPKSPYTTKAGGGTYCLPLFRAS